MRDKVTNTSSDNAQQKTEVSQLRSIRYFRSIRHDLLLAFKKEKTPHTGLVCCLHVFLNGTGIIGEIAFFPHFLQSICSFNEV